MSYDIKIAEIQQATTQVLQNTYPGAGAGRPRVPERLPAMLRQMHSGLLTLSTIASVDNVAGERIEEEALLCCNLIERLLETCERIRRSAPGLAEELRRSPAYGIRWDLMIESRLADGLLPFANSEICPVSFGSMEPFKFGNPPELDAFAELHLRDYEELDEVGSVAHGWARQLAVATRVILHQAATSAAAASRSRAPSRQTRG